jgi:cyclophilin family peptidyl-prolyl cis-trans isomerase
MERPALSRRFILQTRGKEHPMLCLKCLTILGVALALTSCNSNANASEKKTADAKPATETLGGQQVKALGPEDEVAVLATDFGEIVIRFFPDVAPGHVSNFIDLAKSKFYDGTTFHRVIPGFMIQGGDPNSRDDDLTNDGIGRGPRSLKAEFSRIPHVRGIVSMARGQDPNSASSQFFIMVADAKHLDGQYSAFGMVVEGLDVVDMIVGLPRNKSDNPGKATIIRSVTVKKAGDVLKFPLQ